MRKKEGSQQFRRLATSTLFDVVFSQRHQQPQAQLLELFRSVAEIYPYHLFSSPDRDGLESCLSCGRLPDPYDKLLVQVLAALEAHVGPSLPFYDAEKKS
jgi:hypothetical protein